MSLNDKEKAIRERLQKQVEIPDAVMDKVRSAYASIENKEIRQEKAKTPYPIAKRLFQAMGGFAAVLALCFLAYGVNPVIAMELPVIGHLFERLEERVSFRGEFSNQADSLTEQKQTANGLSITFSEVYANDRAIYLTMLVESEEPFPEAQILEIEDWSYPAISLRYRKSFDFLTGMSEDDRFGFTNLEGMFLHDSAYTAILRIPIQEKYQKDMPEVFDLKLDIEEFKLEGWRGNQEEDAKHTYSGDNWSFIIPVTIDNSKTVIQKINETNELGIGLECVIKTPYELIVDEIYPEGSYQNYFMVALDAEGNQLPYNQSEPFCNQFAIQNRDISTVDIYVLDFMKYMDELKVDRMQGDAWRALLEENALYDKTIQFQ